MVGQEKNPQSPERKEGIKQHHSPRNHILHNEFLIIFCPFFLCVCGNFNDLPWVIFTRMDLGGGVRLKIKTWVIAFFESTINGTLKRVNKETQKKSRKQRSVYNYSFFLAFDRLVCKCKHQLFPLTQCHLNGILSHCGCKPNFNFPPSWVKSLCLLFFFSFNGGQHFVCKKFL